MRRAVEVPPVTVSCLTAEVSAGAVRENLQMLRSRLSDGTKLCVVVKADCYGLGLAALLDVISAEADWLAVATPDEALELRRLGYDGPALIFFTPAAAGMDPAAIAELIARDVTLTLVAPAEAAPVALAARRAGRVAQVHVKVDTGMSRSGVQPRDIAPLLEAIGAEADLSLTGMYTHFASADEADLSFTREQLARFDRAVERAGGRDGLCLHAGNSAAALRVPEAHLDMVRVGIAAYGYPPSEEMADGLDLHRPLRLWAPLMQVKHVRAGERCGYGLTHVFQRDSRVGLVPVGYADGYFRSFSNRAMVRVAGAESPVRGRVSMDQITVDLTHAPAVKVGDPVEIISPDPTAANSVENLARIAGTIPYELISRLGRRARRVRVD